jgi:hypothetical protein
VIHDRMIWVVSWPGIGVSDAAAASRAPATAVCPTVAARLSAKAQDSHR